MVMIFCRSGGNIPVTCPEQQKIELATLQQKSMVSVMTTKHMNKQTISGQL